MSKTQHLSQFQKEQYTQYLETQLEKFSAFMLSQKKQNQNYQHLHQVIDDQSKQIVSLNQRLKMLELYQRENFKQCQRIQSSTVRAVDFDRRLQKVESVYFQQPLHRQKENISSRANKSCESVWEQDIKEKFEELRKEVGRKIKHIERDVKNIHEMQINSQRTLAENIKNRTNQTQVSQNSVLTQNYVTKREIKKVEEKLFDYFGQKFSKIQKVVKKNAKKQEKEKNTGKSIEKMLVQEQTFGIQQKFNDYNLDNSSIRPPSHEKSCYTISDTSSRLKPVNYFSLKNGQKKSGKRKSSGKNRSRSKSQQKDKSFDERSKSKSAKSRSKSISQSRSKSHHSRSKSKKTKKTSKAPSTAHSQPQSRHQHPCSTSNEYKMECKKKHF